MQTEFRRSYKFHQSKMYSGEGVIRLKVGRRLATMGRVVSLNWDVCGPRRCVGGVGQKVDYFLWMSLIDDPISALIYKNP